MECLCGILLVSFCQLAINKCENGESGCATGNTSVCTYTGPGTVSCSCAEGYSGSGTTCTGKTFSSFPFSSFPLFNTFLFFQLSITAPFKPQTAHFIRRATTPVLERTHVFVNPATGDPIVIVRTFIGCNFPLIQTQILCFPAINYCTNGESNCSANAICTYTGPGTFYCQCNAALGYEGNGTYCARNYFLFLENPVIFSCSPLFLVS